MITALSIILGITILFLLSAIAHIQAIQKELVELSKEQHTQNKDIIDLLKYKNDSTEMLLQHIEILKYLCEKDPLLSRTPIRYMGPVGEA
jgi:cell division septal protein FtsQ